MKCRRFFKLTGIVLMGLFLTVQVEAGVWQKKAAAKNPIEMKIDKPMIEILSKAYGKSIDASDIVRVQKMLNQIDHITITFKDQDVSDYVLKFKSLSEQELEAWMYQAGYLTSDMQVKLSADPEWMQDMAMHFK